MPLEQRLADARYVTIILRLLLDPQGELIQGEILGAEGEPEERFSGWQGLTGRLRRLLASQRTDPPLPDPLDSPQTG